MVWEKLPTYEKQQRTLRSPGKAIIKVCSLDPVTQISAPKPDLDPFYLLHFVCIIALIMRGGGFSQNCLETELNQFCLKYNKQEFKGGGGGGDSLIKLGTNVR